MGGLSCERAGIELFSSSDVMFFLMATIVLFRESKGNGRR